MIKEPVLRGSRHCSPIAGNVFSNITTVKPLYSGHPWDVANWLLYKGGLIIQCTFNREVLFWTLLGGCFREVPSYTGLRHGCFRQVSLYYSIMRQ